MTAVEQIHAHRSVREFENRAIPEGILKDIMAAAARAPTGGSMQLYSMILTTDPARREALAAVHFGVEHIRNAPAVLTFCIDTHRVSRWVALDGEQPGFDNPWGFALGFSDALLAAQNASLAAESLGLGTCFLGSTVAASPALCRFFECPQHVLPMATMIMGYPAAASGGARSRLPMKAVAHRETYAEPSDEELRNMYAEHARNAFTMFSKVPSIAAATEAFGVSRLEGLYARLNYPGALLEFAGCSLLSAMTRQGFLSETKFARAEAIRRAMESDVVSSLPLVRQLVFAFATANGALDHRSQVAPETLESQLFSFVSSEDASLYDDVATQSLFHPGLRARLHAALDKFGRRLEATAD